MAAQLGTGTFEAWLCDCDGLVQEAPLSDIRKVSGKTVLGIDGFWLLNYLREKTAQTEKYFYLSGVLPVRTHEVVVGFMDALKAQDIKPVVVFDGMPLHHIDFVSYMPQTIQRGTGPYDWAAYANREDRLLETSLSKIPTEKLKDVDQCFSQPSNNPLYDDDVVGALARLLLANDVDVFRAPYWAWPQLAAMLAPSNRYVGDILGAVEIMAFDLVERLVLSVDVARSTFRFVDKDKVMEVLKETERMDSVDDLGLAIMLDSKHKHFAQFEASSNHCRSFQELVHALMSAGPSQRIRPLLNSPIHKVHLASVKHALVFTADAEMTTLSKLSGGRSAQLPRDLFGTQVPALLYYFIFTNVLNPTVLSSVASTIIWDSPLLVESREARAAIERVLPLRTQIIYQLIQQLSAMQYFSGEFALYWHRPGAQTGLPILRPPQIKLDEWHGLNNDEQSTFASVLQYAVNASSSEQLAYESVSQSASAIHLKSLDLLGYFTHATHSNSTEVSGKSVYSDALTLCQPHLSEYGVLLIEMLRTKSLTNDPFTQLPDKYTDNPPPVQYGLNFAIRLVSMLPIKLKSPWTGPTNVPLLAYNALVRHLHRTLRSLAEVIAVTLFLDSCNGGGGPPRPGVQGSRNNFSLVEYKELPNALPFRDPPGIIAGIILRFVLAGTDTLEYRNEWKAATSADSRLSFLAKVFPDVHEMKQELLNIFMFWELAVQMMKRLEVDDTPTIEREMIHMAIRFHNEVMRGAAALFDMQLTLIHSQVY